MCRGRRGSALANVRQIVRGSCSTGEPSRRGMPRSSRRDSLAVEHAEHVVVRRDEERGRIREWRVVGEPLRIGVAVRAHDRETGHSRVEPARQRARCRVRGKQSIRIEVQGRRSHGVSPLRDGRRASLRRRRGTTAVNLPITAARKVAFVTRSAPNTGARSRNPPAIRAGSPPAAATMAAKVGASGSETAIARPFSSTPLA